MTRSYENQHCSAAADRAPRVPQAIDRRGRRGGAAVARSRAGPWACNGAVAPSQRIVLGAIGIGPRGRHDLDCFLAEPDVQFVAICDVRADRRQAVKALADAKYGNHDCAMYRDLFELLGRPDIDAVLIATGDRWHALASILAAKAGKDVYSEKPCGITIALCQALDDTIRRYGRVFQAGTQRRSVSNFQAADPPGPKREAGQAQDPARLDLQSQRQLRLAAGRARAAQGRGRLGPLAGAGPLAAVQPCLRGRRLARLFRLRFRAPRCWTGAPIRSTFASGPTRPTRPCRWSTRPTGGTVTARYANGVQAGHASRRLAGAGDLPRAVRGRRGLGRNGRQRESRSLSGLAPQRVALAGTWPAASPPRRTCGTSSTA